MNPSFLKIAQSSVGLVAKIMNGKYALQKYYGYEKWAENEGKVY